ncbi:carboxyltransferase domain-containing protein, partial [Deinococcus sp.]|uniref:carboxyltransferase domain-containing protein n=1 Tax=Deinococcus sp. TaxID=47478 RepID=UPI00286D8C79
MTALPIKRPRALSFGNLWISAGIIVVLLLYPVFFGKAMNFGVSTVLFAGFAMAWNILVGWAGQTSLGHAALLGVGAYTMTLLAIPERGPAWLQSVGIGNGAAIAPWWGILAGMVLAVLLSLVWGSLTFRLQGSYFTLSSIAVALILRLVAINEDFTGSSQGLFMPDLPTFFGLDLFDRKVEYGLAVGFVVVTLIVTHLIRRSRTGYALQAVREDEDGARALGIDSSDLVRRHTEQEWTVAFCGFAPGFGYLRSSGWVSEVPRRRSPRTRVPAGSVALAGGFTGVYPRESPGGWQLIGRTELSLFDPSRTPAALLRPGDRVRFVNVG